jgi:rubrerythrin
MVVYRSTVDPFRGEGGLYECRVCGTRVRSDSHVGACTDCGESVRNLRVPRD